MTRQPTPGVHQNFAEEADMQDKASVTEAPAALWCYDIQYGPDGETNYAWVYCGAEMVATMRLYNAKCICDGMNAALSVEKAPAVETPPPVQHVEAPKPTAWLTKIYSNDGVLLDTRLDFVKPVIMSTAKTEFVPLFATTEGSAE